LKNARERMDVLAAYREVGSYRGAADICGTTHKTVKRIVERHNAGGAALQRRVRGRNYDEVRTLVAEQVNKTTARSAQSGCCRPRGQPGMTGRRGTSDVWSPR
jgi:Homeodomain-like domain